MTPGERARAWADEAEPKTHNTRNGFDLDAWITAHELKVRSHGPWNDSLRWVLEVCPFNAEHTGGSAAIFRRSNGAPGFKCQHNSCDGKDWRALRDLLDGPRPSSAGFSHGGEKAREPVIRSIADIKSIREYSGQKMEWLWQDVIAARSVNLWTGDSGSGKSTLCAALAGAVDTGQPFASRQTLQCPVLILDKENSLAAIVERFDRIGVNDSATFKVAGGWLPDEIPHPWSTVVVEWVEACTPKPLIIVDGLTAFNPGNENDAQETRAYMAGFRRLADMGVTVMVLHHSGKGESAKDYRGSSDIKASVDLAYHVTNLSGDPGRLGTVRLKAFKTRFSAEPDVSLRYVEDRFISDDRPPVKTMAESLNDLLKANPGVRKRDFEELAAAKDITRVRARNFLRDGMAQGSIREDRGDHNTRFYTWVEGEAKNAALQFTVR